MKNYTIIGGVNGVGKTSFTGLLKTQRSDLGIIIDADAINLKHGGNIIKGGKEASQLISKCIERGCDFTQETTLSGKKTLNTINEAKKNDYSIRLYYIAVSSAEESMDRIANRVRKGGHNIPDEDVIRRYGKRFDDLLKILPYCNEVHFYDNENGFRRVGEYSCGEINAVCDTPPAWLCELKKLSEQ